MPLRRAREQARSLGYFDLLDAFRQPGCPICHLLVQRSRRFLDTLFYERVNDPLTRVELRASLGFCNWHAWIATEIFNTSDGLAIICADLLGRVSAQLDGYRRQWHPFSALQRLGQRLRERLGWRARSWRAARRPCPTCETAGTFERWDLEHVLSYLGEPRFFEAFRESAGLCLPHLLLTLALYPTHPRLPRLMDEAVRKFRALVAELEEHLRKLDYRFRHEPWGPEADAWRRAVEALMGRRGVFGNDLHEDWGRLPLGTGGRKGAESEAVTSGGPPFEATLEQRVAEQGGLERENRALREKWMDADGQIATLRYEVWRLREDNKILEMKHTGASSQAEALEHHVASLREEIERLEGLLKGGLAQPDEGGR